MHTYLHIVTPACLPCAYMYICFSPALLYLYTIYSFISPVLYTICVYNMFMIYIDIDVDVDVDIDYALFLLYCCFTPVLPFSINSLLLLLLLLYSYTYACLLCFS